MSEDDLRAALERLLRQQGRGGRGLGFNADMHEEAVVDAILADPTVRAALASGAVTEGLDVPRSALGEVLASTFYEVRPGVYRCRTCEFEEYANHEGAHDPDCEATLVRQWLARLNGASRADLMAMSDAEFAAHVEQTGLGPQVRAALARLSGATDHPDPLRALLVIDHIAKGPAHRRELIRDWARVHAEELAALLASGAVNTRSPSSSAPALSEPET